MNLDEWLLGILNDDDREKLVLYDAWVAAVDATIQALLDGGCIDENYRKEWTEIANQVKGGE